MTEAIIAAALLVAATIVGALLQPTPDQTRPIYPEELSGHTQSDSPDHHSHGH